MVRRCPRLKEIKLAPTPCDRVTIAHCEKLKALTLPKMGMLEIDGIRGSKELRVWAQVVKLSNIENLKRLWLNTPVTDLDLEDLPKLQRISKKITFTRTTVQSISLVNLPKLKVVPKLKGKQTRKPSDVEGEVVEVDRLTVYAKGLPSIGRFGRGSKHVALVVVPNDELELWNKAVERFGQEKVRNWVQVKVAVGDDPLDDIEEGLLEEIEAFVYAAETELEETAEA